MDGTPGRDLIQISGGMFPLWKSTQEIWESLDGAEDGHSTLKESASYWAVLGQIAVIDMVFSPDSFITAVGMAEYVPVSRCKAYSGSAGSARGFIGWRGSRPGMRGFCAASISRPIPLPTGSVAASL